MTTPLAQFAGVASGFNYQTLVDAIIQQESAPVTRMQAQQDAIKAQQSALATYRGLLSNLRTASGALTDGTAFTSAAATTQLLTGTKQNVSASGDATAAPGSYVVQVTQLARAAKLSGSAQSSASAALALAGTFTINGQTVTVASGDSLSSIRDQINALNSGTTPLGVTATILSVSPTDQRLVLTSRATGAAGITLADTSGTVLQSLGFLDNTETLQSSAVLVSGADAQFTIDNIPITRSTNTVTDAIQGVTLTLTSEEAGASTSVTIDHDINAAHSAMQAFTDAYNAIVNFAKQQGTVTGTTKPPLYGDSMLRTIRSGLPALLLQTVGGAASDFATAASAGLSLGRDGTLSFNATTFDSAFTSRYSDLTALFAERSSSTGANLSYVSSGNGAANGTYAVNITAPATTATIASTGFSGTYNDGGTPDTITLTDNANGKSTSVQLTTGMTTAQIVAAFDAALTSAGMGIVVAATGNDVQFTHSSAGSHAGITIAVAGTGDGLSELWSSNATSYGTDVQGTIGGQSATGSGSLLIADSGTPMAGLSVRYDGTGTGAVGSVTVNPGTGALVNRLLDTFVQTGSGLLDTRDQSMSATSATLDDRIAAKNEALDRRRAALVAQFVQMEQVISQLKQASASLLGAANSNSNSTTGGLNNGSIG